MKLKLNTQGTVQAIIGGVIWNPALIIVIGPPGSGKTTFAEALKHAGFEFDHVSSDHSDSRMIEKQMKYMLLKYSEAIGYRRNVLIDQTNMTVAKRRGFINHASSWGCKVIAVDLCNVPPETMIERCKKRAEAGGRPMPASVIYDLYQKYEPASPTEGFDVIYEVQP